MNSHSPSRSTSALLLGVAALWLGGVVGGLGLLQAYKAKAGPSDSPPQIDLTGDAGQPRLTMFIHPHCPCTRASLSELERILRAAGRPIAAQVVVVRPPEVTAGWEQTELTAAAARIPGVTVVCDRGGELATRLGAQTSGQVLFYDAAGQLAFRGGITRSRGHEGDNPGSRAVSRLLHGETTDITTSSTYGCPLLTPSLCSQRATGACPAVENLP